MKQFKPFLIAFLVVTTTMFGIGMISCATSVPVKAVKLKPPEVKRLLAPHYPIKNMYDSSVGIFKLTSRGMRVLGAGVVLKYEKDEPMLVLSAWHVVSKLHAVGGENVAVIVGVKRTKEFRLMYIAKKLPSQDLVLLKGIVAEKEDGPYVRLARDYPPIGSTLWIIGSPNGVERNVSKGILSQVVIRNGLYYYRTDAATFYGNSGGGMYNQSGELVGIIQKGSIYPGSIIIIPGSGLALGLVHLHRFLEGIL